ncbi:MAG: hypothetical protein ACJ766_09175 [Thermoleophilaceae bacterium]|jgi:hypothetical protein
MRRLSDAHHFRKMVAGMCMMFGPLVLLVGLVIHPESKTSEGAQLAVIADHLDQWYVAHLLILISIALAVPAVLGLMHMLRERQVAFGHVGGGLGLLGLLALTGLVTMDGFVGWQAAAGGNRAAMTSLFHSLHHTTGVVIPFFVVSFALSLGLICLAIGLYRAHAVQWWMALFLAVAAVCFAIANPAALNWLAIVGGAFLFVGLGSVGRMVMAESDEDWEHTPEYKGFRPTLGMR